MIVYNEGDSPIRLITKWSTDPNGGASRIDMHYYLAPGDGMELDIINLKPRPPIKECKCDQARIKGLEKQRQL